ncbi:MAG: hypothetical protein OCD02_01205 [Spirochaetaceae bacterium]
MKFLLTVISLLLCINIGATDWQSLVPGASVSDVSTLESGEFVVKSGIDYSKGLSLLPIGIDISADFLADIKNYDPELCVEMLYLLDKPTKTFSSSDDYMLYLLNNLRAFSEQVGIEYFSNRKQAMSLLVEDSFFISDPNSKETISDPVNNSIIPVQEDFYYQKDTTFGANKYKLTTNTTSKTIWLQMENLGKLKVYTFFKALDAGGQRVNFIVHPIGDKVLFYAIAQIKDEPKIKSILGYKVNIPYSFQRRMDSIAKWYIRRVK